MDKTATEQTIEYIKEHADIKSCLKKGIINYSSLARLISTELKIENSTSIESILVAARRFQDKLKKDLSYEKKIRDILNKSEIEIKNKINTFIIQKEINYEEIQNAIKSIKKENGLFYLLEGSDSFTIITQEKYVELIEKNFKGSIIKKNNNLALINLKSSNQIESVPGVIAYITSLFSENGVNIIEFLSCWTDTMFVVKSEDVNKTMSFLNF